LRRFSPRNRAAVAYTTRANSRRIAATSVDRAVTGRRALAVTDSRLVTDSNGFPLLFAHGADTLDLVDGLT